MMNLVAQIRDRLCKNIVEIPGRLVRTFGLLALFFSFPITSNKAMKFYEDNFIAVDYPSG
jgi:hypothetical protein